MRVTGCIMAVIALTAVMLPGIGTAVAQQAETIAFESRQKGKPVQITATIYWPATSGRVSALVLHHGSTGVNAGLIGLAERFALSGVAAVVIDSFKGRGVGSTVQDQSLVSRDDFNFDALALLKVLGQNPRINSNKIGIAGFSKGAGSTLMAAQIAERNAAGVPSNLKYIFHVAFYPSCAVQPYRPRTTGAPIVMLLGGADTYVGAEPCETYGQALRAEGANIDIKVFPGAPHGFDSAEAGSDPRGQNTSQCVYQQQANGSWVERKTRVQVAGPDGRWNASAVAKAAAGCQTLGVSWGPNADARRLSHAELRAYVQRYLLGGQ
ncbi:MAG: dienelactone hydrolase family protein [Alphaproteobacteria bacterium]|nr:dienelactone hydrolase family protein [Alphaproteobacteria bacterium]